VVKGIGKQRTANGEVRTEILVGDYRKEGGILTAHRIVTKSPGDERVITLRTLIFNQEAPPGTFDIPEAVRALMPKP
jgi:hypothetical protein